MDHLDPVLGNHVPDELDFRFADLTFFFSEFEVVVIASTQMKDYVLAHIHLTSFIILILGNLLRLN